MDSVPRSRVWLEPGESGFFVEAFDARSAAGVPLPFGAVRVGPFPAGVSEVEVVLGEELVITGAVRTAEGAGVAGAAVSARAVDPAGGTHREVRTDKNGEFRLGGLWAGLYEVGVAPLHGYRPGPPIRVACGSRGVYLAVDVAK